MIQDEAKAKATNREREGGVGGAAGRRRAALEMVSRYEHSLKRTARRYSLDTEDVEHAFQRALEIVLTKAPTTDPRELIRWTQTVIKHEALAVRRNRERLLGLASGSDRATLPHDPVAQLPATSAGPAEQAERREDLARTREALQALKPAELRTLTLLAEGYSYAEIADITGFSLTKINRSLAEGRERFRSIVCSSESGERCHQLRPLISAYCDGEANAGDSALVREHLRACAHCRATMRTYKTAPRLAAALVPMPAVAPSLLSRVKDLFGNLATQAGAVKQAALCVGVAGSVAAGMATGVLPGPLEQDKDQPNAPTIERVRITGPARLRNDASAKDRGKRQRATRKASQSRPTEPNIETGPTPPIEYAPPAVAPPPEPIPPPATASESSPSSASAAGEFGP
ncbi:MAG TPA: sigma-70 family RNA polymerase sigma factor [Solirubrobacterales bacterium]|nr:sigma-70 family RNA polymerase sigma factor [Solirubrobacterales bacterium]